MGSDELMRRAMADSNHVIQRERATGDGGSAKRESRIQRLMSTFELAGIPTSREQTERAVDDAAREKLPEF